MNKDIQDLSSKLALSGFSVHKDDDKIQVSKPSGTVSIRLLKPFLKKILQAGYTKKVALEEKTGRYTYVEISEVQS